MPLNIQSKNYYSDATNGPYFFSDIMKGAKSMKKRYKITIITISVIVLICLSVVLGGFIRIKVLESKLWPVTKPFSEMERVPICVDRIFPLSDDEKCIGFSDYVFIGTVEEILGTKYNDLHYNGFKLWDHEGPETYYRIKSRYDIKGNAPEEMTIICYSGQNPDGTLTEIDPLAEDKTTYLFMCCETDGEYRMFNCHYLGGYDWFDTSENTDDVIARFETAFRNQDLSVRYD